MSLSRLDLSLNEISEIPQRAWPSMNALLYLDLSDNYLGDSLDGGSFLNLLTLRGLDISRNHITDPPWESLFELKTLQFLNLKVR